VSAVSESTTEQIVRLCEQDAAGRAEDAVHRAAGAVRDQAETVSSTVRSHPLPALLIAAVIGFVLGRMRP
jgi:ElaB/YqjD/DUF883 family membrane-anchored ribosome-binding protein